MNYADQVQRLMAQLASQLPIEKPQPVISVDTETMSRLSAFSKGDDSHVDAMVAAEDAREGR